MAIHGSESDDIGVEVAIYGCEGHSGGVVVSVIYGSKSYDNEVVMSIYEYESHGGGVVVAIYRCTTSGRKTVVVTQNRVLSQSPGSRLNGKPAWIELAKIPSKLGTLRLVRMTGSRSNPGYRTLYLVHTSAIFIQSKYIIIYSWDGRE